MRPIGDFWVFGYGSLIWNPEFPHEESVPALLRGYHRDFCIYSLYHRGTPQKPGLVLGLDRGGACRGVAYRVHEENADDVMDYLTEREIYHYPYEEKWLPVDLQEGRKVRALCYVVIPGDTQYAGRLALEDAARIIVTAKGVRGYNRDYLRNTVTGLRKRGFTDRRLVTLLHRVDALAAQEA